MSAPIPDGPTLMVCLLGSGGRAAVLCLPCALKLGERESVVPTLTPHLDWETCRECGAVEQEEGYADKHLPYGPRGRLIGGESILVSDDPASRVG